MAQSPIPAVLDPSRRVEAVTPYGAPSLQDAADLSSRTIFEDNAFAPESPGDNDIGQQLILKKTPKTQPFSFTTEGYLFYTNNAARTSAGGIGDSFYGWRAAASFQPKLGKRLFADISLSEDWFRYDKLDVLNFESMEVSASLLYALPELADSLLFAGYNYNRITKDFDSLLNNHSVRAGIQKTVLIDRRNSIGLSLMSDWNMSTDAAAIKRNQYSADVGWKFKIMQDLQLSLGYRYTFFDYAHFNRGDHFHNLAFGVNYTPWKWCSVYLSTTYSFNISNYNVYSYEAANFGGGAGVRIKF